MPVADEEFLNLKDPATGLPYLRTDAERDVAKKIVNLVEPLSTSDRRKLLKQVSERSLDFDEFGKSSYGSAYNAGRIEALADGLRGEKRVEGGILTARREAALARRRMSLDESIAQYATKERSIEHELEGLRELREWLRQPMVLEKPEGSAWYKLLQAAEGKQVRSIYADSLVDQKAVDEALSIICSHAENIQVFVIQHDWAKAFEKATDFADGEWGLPYEACCFEFRITGHRICAIPVACTTDHGALILVNTRQGWFSLGLYSFAADQRQRGDSELGTLVVEQIRAICIALEAEVATSSVTRAPHKLNSVRAKKGLLPLRDYHVVSLVRRSRPEPLGDRSGVGEGTRKRLHFRRGHWRHYDNHKVWIKWTLVGDPDLGFIDKHYAL